MWPLRFSIPVYIRLFVRPSIRHSVRSRFSWRPLISTRSRYQAINIDIAASYSGGPGVFHLRRQVLWTYEHPMVSLEAKGAHPTPIQLNKLCNLQMKEIDLKTML